MRPDLHNFADKLVRSVPAGRVYEIDTAKARYFNFAWRDLGSFGRRKFENLLFFRDSSQPMKVIYI